MSVHRTYRTLDQARAEHGGRVFLAPEDIPELARLIAAHLAEDLDARRRPAADEPLVKAADVAGWAGMSRGWVYANAERLGGFRLGEGRRAPWRWRLSDVQEAFDPWPGYGWLREADARRRARRVARLREGATGG